MVEHFQLVSVYMKFHHMDFVSALKRYSKLTQIKFNGLKKDVKLSIE